MTKIAPYLFLNDENGFYYVRKSFKKLRIPDLYESTKERTKGKAQAVANARIAEHQMKYLGVGSPFQTGRESRRISEVIEEILRTVTPTKRVGTQENHKFYLGELSREVGIYDVGKFSVTIWSDWLREFKKRKDRKTFDDYAKHMNLVMRYAYSRRYCSHLLVIPNPDKKREDTGRVFTKDEINRLWSVMSEDLRDQFVLSYECMMRLREALKLSWDRVDFDSQTITLRADDVKTGSKTGRGRIFRMSPAACERLKARYANRKNDRWVFPSPTGDGPVNQNKTAWIEVKRKAQIKGRARWHDLRHTTISRALLEANANAVLLSEYAGVSIRTIQRVYLHSTADLTSGVAFTVKVDEEGVKKA